MDEPLSAPIDAARPFALVGAFAKALAHVIRTPLSVISNDLHYLSGFVPGAEIKRTSERCRGIAEALSSVELLGSGPLEVELVDLAELAGDEFRGMLTTLDGPSVIDGDRGRLASLFKILSELLLTPSARVTLEKTRISIALSPARERRASNSLTAGLVVSAERTCRAVLADAIIWAHGGGIGVGQDAVEIHFPPSRVV